MRSEWDMPRPAVRAMQTPADERHAARRPAELRRAPANDSPQDGILDPMALVALLSRNLVKIGIITGVLTAMGVAVLTLYPFPYKATAIVIADPRDQRVMLQEEVMPSIGADAAILESMVQIVKSDGFLLKSMQDLGIMGEPGAMDQTGRLKELAKFRKKLSVERKGATYLVEIAYSADNGEDAARIANGIAAAFADSQNRSRSDATENAAKSLASRLIELRANLNKSEEAVAQFKADNGIVYIDQNNTLEMRQLTELSQQLALAKNATEDARARFDELKNGGSISISSQQTGEGSQLAFLRQQRTGVAQSLEQQQQIYGPRHPNIMQAQQMLRSIDNQIAQERRLLADQLKATLDVAAAKQKELQKQIAALSTGVGLTEAAQVKLEALDREAAANREIYQQFLSRNKQTDELALLVEDNVRIVSAAIAPLRSTKPSLILVGPALALLSLAIATLVVIGGKFGSIIKPRVRTERAARPERSDEERPMVVPQMRETAPRRPVPQREPISLLDAWADEDGISTLNALHERMENAEPNVRAPRNWIDRRPGGLRRAS